MGPGATTVLIGKKAAARIGDTCQCNNPTPDVIVRGAMPIRVATKPAARESDLTAHGGKITRGCQNVLLGLAGISGDFFAGITRCAAMAAGRQPAQGNTNSRGQQLKSGTKAQSYNNCGVESSRQLIQQATGSTITQEQLLAQALATRTTTTPFGTIAQVVGGGSRQMYLSGGTVPASRAQLLTNNGVPAGTQTATMANLETALGNGQGVIASVDASRLPNWPTNTPPQTLHAITVTGVEYDANGNPIKVVVNDTGTGNCGLKMPYATFQRALSGRDHVVTTNPIW
jgi:hypothetical protein